MKKILLGIIIGLQLVVLGVLLVKYLKLNINLSVFNSKETIAAADPVNIEPPHVASISPTLPDTENKQLILPDTLDAFIPDNFLCIDTVFGNLNFDEFRDVILTLKEYGEHDISPKPDRLLLIITGSPEGLKLADKSNAAVMRLGNYGGDSFKKVVIKNGFFSVEHSYGDSDDRLETIVTFKYSKVNDNWILHRVGQIRHKKIGVDTFKDFQDIETEKDFGEVLFSNYNIHNEVFNPH